MIYGPSYAVCVGCGARKGQAHDPDCPTPNSDRDWRPDPPVWKAMLVGVPIVAGVVVALALAPGAVITAIVGGFVLGGLLLVSALLGGEILRWYARRRR